jgi:hypothetical protein
VSTGFIVSKQSTPADAGRTQLSGTTPLVVCIASREGHRKFRGNHRDSR